MQIRPLLLAMLALTGCTLAPALEMPDAVVPPGYPDGVAYDDTLIETGEDEQFLSAIDWSSYFQDATLRDLIRQGLEHNRSLKQAALDIAGARAQYGIERSAYFPELQGSSSFSRQELPFGGFGQGGQQGGQQVIDNNDSGPIEFYTASAGISDYELDLFGRIQSRNDAALNRFLASQAARDGLRTTLIADIAGAYTTLRADQALLTLAESTIEVQQESLALIEKRREAGIANTLELRQAQILLEQARTDRIALRRAVAQDRNALRLLLGTPSEMPELPAQEPVASLDGIAPLIPIGLPSTLLAARPDIREAEHALRAANADIGAARAAFFPRITLTTTGGYQSTELDGLFSAGNQFWQFSPSLSLPIFTWGRLSNNLELAEIRSHQAIIAYEQAIETAFRDVADALAGVTTYREQAQAQQRLIDASADAVRISELRYREGIENYLAVLDARRELYAARQARLRVKAGETAARIRLYKAVGGGREVVDAQ